jgi:hypothetical protein
MRITTKHLFRIFYAILILSILGGFLVRLYLHPHLFFSWQSLPIFAALYGFIGCVIIILGSKALGHFWLMKKEDYYETHPPKQGEES